MEDIVSEPRVLGDHGLQGVGEGCLGELFVELGQNIEIGVVVFDVSTEKVGFSEGGFARMAWKNHVKNRTYWRLQYEVVKILIRYDSDDLIWLSALCPIEQDKRKIREK